MADRPLAAEFAARCDAAGITPDDPGITLARTWNAQALARAGVGWCMCPHLSVDHHLRSNGTRAQCLVIDGPSGVRCGCGEFTPRGSVPP